MWTTKRLRRWAVKLALALRVERSGGFVIRKKTLGIFVIYAKSKKTKFLFAEKITFLLKFFKCLEKHSQRAKWITVSLPLPHKKMLFLPPLNDDVVLWLFMKCGCSQSQNGLVFYKITTKIFFFFLVNKERKCCPGTESMACPSLREWALTVRTNGHRRSYSPNRIVMGS